MRYIRHSWQLEIRVSKLHVNYAAKPSKISDMFQGENAQCTLTISQHVRACMLYNQIINKADVLI